MDFGLIFDLAPVTLALAFGIALLSGVIKGAVGFGMPLVMVSGLSSLMDPKFALAAIVFPIVFSNGLQTFRDGVAPAVSAVRDYWRYVVMVCFAIFLSAQLVPHIPSRLFYFVLGVPVVLVSLIQLFGVRLTIPPGRRVLAEWLIGTVTGIFGGLVGTWGPTTVLFLLAVNTPKDRQMIVQGVVYGLGSLTLMVAHFNSGILNSYTAPFSAILLPLGLLGMWIGFRIQDRLDQERFRKMTLIVLVVAGLNLLRKGIIG